MPNAFQQIKQDQEIQRDKDWRVYLSMLMDVDLYNASKTQSKRLGELMNKLSLSSEEVEDQYKNMRRVIKGWKGRDELPKLQEESDKAAKAEQDSLAKRQKVWKDLQEEVKNVIEARQSASGAYDAANKESGFAVQTMRDNPIVAELIKEKFPLKEQQGEQQSKETERSA